MNYKELQTEYTRAIARDDKESAYRLVISAIQATDDIFALEGLRTIRESLATHLPRPSVWSFLRSFKKVKA